MYPHRVRCAVVSLHDGFLQTESARQTRWGGALLSQRRLDGVDTSVREEKVFREETERLGRVHYFMAGVGTQEKWVAWVRQIFGRKSAVTPGNFLTHGCCVATFVSLCDHSHIPIALTLTESVSQTQIRNNVGLRIAGDNLVRWRLIT